MRLTRNKRHNEARRFVGDTILVRDQQTYRVYSVPALRRRLISSTARAYAELAELGLAAANSNSARVTERRRTRRGFAERERRGAASPRRAEDARKSVATPSRPDGSIRQATRARKLRESIHDGKAPQRGRIVGVLEFGGRTNEDRKSSNGWPSTRRRLGARSG